MKRMLSTEERCRAVARTEELDAEIVAMEQRLDGLKREQRALLTALMFGVEAEKDPSERTP